MLTRASTEEPYSVAGLVARYKRFQQDQHPIPPIELAWMQSLCDEVRARVGPLPLDIKKYPEAYLPFMHTMLRDMETRNQHLILKEKEQRPYKTGDTVGEEGV